MTHTPGPWTLNQNWFGRMSILAGDIRIANCPHLNLGKMEKKLGQEEGRRATTGFANGCLIAAAPDLLAALFKVLPLAETYLRTIPGTADHETAATIAAARAAIAKAEGAS